MHGGKRAGSGRKRGSLAKKTTEVAQRAAEEGITPLEVMLKAMTAHYNARRYDEAAAVAKDAAPYMHPRLSAMQVSGEMTHHVRRYVGIDPESV
jgi:hypothetical protein